MEETQVSAVFSSDRILNSGNRYQSYLNILVLFSKRKMCVRLAEDVRGHCRHWLLHR